MHFSPRILVWFTVGCTLCALAAWAGPAPQVPPQHPPFTGDRPAVKVTTRLVEVNVIVLDRKGQPVRGLTRDDFAVFDEGAQQVIRAFSVEGKQASQTFGGKVAIPSNVYSNQNLPANSGTLSVILFDELNTKIQDKLFARTRILRFLSQLKPEDRVAIYLLSDRLRVLHDFSSDSAALARVVSSHTGTAARRLDSSELSSETIGDEMIDAFVENASRRIDNQAIRDRVRRTLVAVESIARYLAPVSGRKNLIWVSGGFPLTLGFDPRRPGDTTFREQDLFTAEVERAARAINEANIAIYPIDARGLFTDPMDDHEFRADQSFFISRRGQSEGYDRASDNGNQARESGGNGQGQQNQRAPARPRIPILPPPAATQGLRRLDETIDTMVLLADRTGGRAFYNSNDIASALRATLDESELSYRLAFEPSHNQWNGAFRRIKVRVKLDGLRLRHRQGYLAQPEPARDSNKQLAALRDSAASPINFGDLSLRAQMLPSPNARQLLVRLLVESSHLALRPEAGAWKGAVDVYFETANEAGSPLWSDGRRIAFSLTPSVYHAALQQGVPMNKTVPRAPAARQLRIAIRDVQTGAIGSLRIPLDEVK